MAVIEISRVVALLLCILPALYSEDVYRFPEVSIAALKPQGLVISVSDDPKGRHLNIFATIYRPRLDKEITSIIEFGNRVNYRNNYIQLEVGDVVHYNIHMYQGYLKLYLVDGRHVITELYDSNSWTEPNTTEIRKETTGRYVPITSISPPIITTRKPAPMHSAECKETSTLVLWPESTKSVCAEQIIFEDNFDIFRDDLWTIEEYIPSNPEYPFMSYQRPMVSVENGILRIQPQLQENLPGFDSAAITYSTLNLSLGCTRTGSCIDGSDDGNILPPIASGRITSKMFSFKYGFVEVRAKVPQGDWLYPDILLESLLQKYGNDDYASGVLKIAGVLGNLILGKGQEEYGNKVLSGGPVMDFKCRNNLLVKKISKTEWGEDFHVYSLRWAPEMITLAVDGEEWGRIEPPIDGLQTRLPKDTCGLLHRSFLKTPMAPFDDYFHIVLGVSAGGVSEFPDSVVSLYTRPKPWKNAARRARLDFITAKNSWLPTWTQPALLVDYIRVRAL